MIVTSTAWRRAAAAIGVAAAVLLAAPLPGRDLVGLGSGSTWKYLDTGAAPMGWSQVGFDDSRWKSGAAPLGYGATRLNGELRPAAPGPSTGSGQGPKPLTTWFRREFVAPDIKPGERLVLVLCVDDGAVAFLNGREIGRFNLPAGPVTAATAAAREMAGDQEGFYVRLQVPAGVVRPRQKNVLAVEVHQASPNNADLFFDAALKTVTGNLPAPGTAPAALAVLNTFHKQHYLGPAVRIPDGYFDGGRFMLLGTGGGVKSGREILMVDRARDVELAKHEAFARSSEVISLPPLQRVQRLAAHIDDATTPPGGDRWVGPTVEQLTREFSNKPVLIGEVLDQCQAGVCRHRALLFKILGDDAGLKTALVRGNYAKTGTNGFAHAWNEVTLDDGRRVLVDVMHHGGKAVFPEITADYVVKHYLKENNTPWYKAK